MQENSTHFWFNVTHFQGYGGGEEIWLEVYLMLPPSIPEKGEAESNAGYKVGQNKTFVLKANVTCRGGNCGEVNGTLRYNLSSSEWKPVNTASDTPFYIVNSSSGISENPVSCGILNENEACVLNWTINSTGDLQSLWKLDVMFNSSTAGNNTNYTKIEITLVLILSLTFSEVNFGVCDPVTYGNPALLNDELGYNISLNENSNDADALYIKGTDLEPQSIPGFGNITYKIGVGNLTWNDNENLYESTNTTRLTSDYELIRSDVPAGTNITMYYWIDIPTGQYAQGYDGMLYIKVNTTMGY